MGLQRDEATWTHPATGHTLFSRIWRASSARTLLVLLHGFGEHGGRYEETAEHFARRGLSTCCLDLWGHGRSSGPRGDIERFEGYLEDLDGFLNYAAVLEARSSERPALLGHSFGGLLAVHWALRHPEAIRCLILQSPLLGVGFPVPAWKERLVESLGRVVPRLAVPMGLDPAGLSRDPEVGVRYRQDPLVHGRITARAYAAMRQAMREAMTRAPQLEVPTLLLYGTGDRVVSHQACEDFAGRLTAPHRVRAFAGAYHELHHESVSSEVVDAVVQWIGAHA